MKKEVLAQSAAVLMRLQNEYYAYTSNLNSPVCLHDHFCRNGFSLKEYCQSFRPHLHARQIRSAIEQFGTRYGIWLEQAPDYITCHIYLFPNAHLYRMMSLLKNCAVDFYLNDVYGREVFHQLPEKIKENARLITRRICDPDTLFAEYPGEFPVEQANREMMLEIKSASPAEWFKRFYDLYNIHIKTAHTDCESSATGIILGVGEYIDLRCHISGMHHSIMLIEFAEGQFLDWNWLNETHLEEKLKRAQYLIAAIGCLSNDLFSFEKEVIRNNSDSNLVAILAYNHPELSLTEVLIKAAEIVGKQIEEFLELVVAIRMDSYQLLPRYQHHIDVLENHLSGLERVLQASWVWQVKSRRYKCINSVFEETQAQEMVTV